MRDSFGRPWRLGEPRDPDPIDTPVPRAEPLDLGAKRPHRLAGVDHVLTFQKDGNRRFADRQGARQNLDLMLRQRFRDQLLQAGLCIRGVEFAGDRADGFLQIGPPFPRKVQSHLAGHPLA